MATYNNYGKDEDYMMWELHKIRKEIASKKLSAKSINENATRILKKYKLRNINLIKFPQNQKSA
jgi:hypothetical protein